MTNYKDLEAWKTSMDLVKALYRITKTFPKEEVFGLTSQIKRGAVSIPSNLAEGIGRRGAKECTHFLSIARGSGYELETLITVARMISILSEEQFNSLDLQISSSLRLLNGLIRHYEQKQV